MKGHFRSRPMARGNSPRHRLAWWQKRGLLAIAGLLAAGLFASSVALARGSDKVANIPGPNARRARPALSSRSFVVIDQATSETLLSRDADEPRSIASISKLMSAMVYLDMKPDLDEVVEVSAADRKGARPAHTRLQKGWKLTARDLLHAALIASENPAVEALARSTGLTRPEFVGLMNRKAQQLGMTHSIFFDASGLDANNTASARDVAKMLEAASQYPLIAQITTMPDYEATVLNRAGRKLHYVNSDRLARSSSYEVITGKTGYISDAGYCLAVNTQIDGNRKLLMVFLGAPARLSRFGDAARAITWVEAGDVTQD